MPIRCHGFVDGVLGAAHVESADPRTSSSIADPAPAQHLRVVRHQAFSPGCNLRKSCSPRPVEVRTDLARLILVPTRFEFTPRDLTRTRIGRPLGPLGETVQALSHLAGPRPPRPQLRAAEVQQRAQPEDRAMASFLWLRPPSVGLDLFTITEPVSVLAEGRDALLDLDQDTFAVEADLWASIREGARQRAHTRAVADPAAWMTSGLRDGQVGSRRRLFDELARFHRSAVAPHWAEIADRVAREEDRLGQLLAYGGVEALWQALADQVRWSGSVLELPVAGMTGSCVHEYRLGGRGIAVVPSFFARGAAAFIPADPASPVMLIVPCPPAGPDVRAEASTRSGRTGELLGPTRTAVLRAISRGPQTTTELGRTLGIAISGASNHAGVLRRGGMVRTTRDGGRVLHTLTPLGRSVLDHL